MEWIAAERFEQLAAFHSTISLIAIYDENPTSAYESCKVTSEIKTEFWISNLH
jgi:hypothetical protein